jgi:hypothetical protein
MCATVCPSRALHYGTWEEIERLRPRSVPQNIFRFGRQEVRTKVYMMVPREAQTEYLDVASALTGQDDARTAVAGEEAVGNDPMLLNILQ